MNNTAPDQPREISDQRLQKRLENKALHYLGRYSASTAQLEVILRKFAKRKIGVLEESQLAKAIQAVTQKAIEYGYIDDARHIRNHLRQARQSGKSQKIVIQKLKSQGLDEQEIRRHIEEIFEPDSTQGIAQAEPDDIELLAALYFLRKKKMGCYASTQPSLEEKYKHLGRLARRGFSYAICSKAFGFEHEEDADQHIQEIENRLPHHLA